MEDPQAGQGPVTPAKRGSSDNFRPHAGQLKKGRPVDSEDGAWADDTA